MQTDVLVIGGGVIGLCTAYEASRRGARVVLLEKGSLGDGSSRGNAGLLVPSSRKPLPAPGVIRQAVGELTDPEGFFGLRPRPSASFAAWLLRFGYSCRRSQYARASRIVGRLASECMNAHGEWSGQASNAYEFEQNGVLSLYIDRKKFQRDMEAYDQDGIPVRGLSGSRVPETEPGVGPGVVGGILRLEDGRIQPARFLEWLADRITAAGGSIHIDSEVYGFRTGRHRLVAALSTKGEFRAEQIVLATGAWLRPLGKRLGVNLPIEGGKGLSLTFSEPGFTTSRPMMLENHHVAVTPFAGALRITGALELAGLDRSLDPRRVQGIFQSVQHYLPGARTLRGAEIWRGLRPCSPDGLPLMGRLKRFANVLVAGGHDTRGMTWGPLTGKRMADLLGGRSLGELENPLSPDRF